MKRIVSYCAMLITIVISLSGCVSNELIGSVSGAEHQYITIGEDSYTVCYDSDYHASDRNQQIGIVAFEDEDIDPMKVYSIKGVEDNEYIYTLWLYDGYIYKKDIQ